MKKKKKILIVDDSELDRNALSSVLKKKGFEVIALSGPEKCIETVETNFPDALLLDILMPNISGQEILHQLRATFNPIDLPILMITVKSHASDVIESLSLGANDYIAKPVDYEIALMRINTHLRISELSRDLIKLKELEALTAMITTYNHELNNPLSVALGALKGFEHLKEDKNYTRLEGALWKVAEVVNKIKDVTKKGRIEYDKYANASKLVKID